MTRPQFSELFPLDNLIQSIQPLLTHPLWAPPCIAILTLISSKHPNQLIGNMSLGESLESILVGGEEWEEERQSWEHIHDSVTSLLDLVYSNMSSEEPIQEDDPEEDRQGGRRGRRSVPGQEEEEEEQGMEANGNHFHHMNNNPNDSMSFAKKAQDENITVRKSNVVEE